MGGGPSNSTNFFAKKQRGECYFPGKKSAKLYFAASQRELKICEMCLDTSSTISRSRAWFWSFHLKIWIFVKETCENPHCDMWQSGSRGTIAWSRSQAGLGESGSDSQSHLWKGDRSSSMPGVWTSFSFMNFSTKVEIISWFKICSKGDAALLKTIGVFFLTFQWLWCQF